MRVAKSIEKIRRIIAATKRKRKTIGFVPTMGALHKGHLSLVRIARKKSDFVVVSVFVNPTQFEPHEDLRTYPRDMKRDLVLLKREGADLVFTPSVRTLYPEHFRTRVTVSGLSSLLCGKSRPHHFQGVTTIVLKILNIVQPDIAVFGKKDYQQAVIIKRMVKDLNVCTRIILGPTVREPDGLAMSSRNQYLSKRERANAVILYHALQWARASFKDGSIDVQKALAKMRRMIRSKGGKIDYVKAVDRNALTPAKKLKKGILIAVAVYFGSTRLIDNTIL
jgi:pantoate--beta-alanine ligase